MPRRLPYNMGGYVYHALNRAVGRATLFHQDADYAAFLKTLRQAKAWQPIRLLGYCTMPNHWHLVLWFAAVRMGTIPGCWRRRSAWACKRR